MRESKGVELRNSRKFLSGNGLKDNNTHIIEPLKNLMEQNDGLSGYDFNSASMGSDPLQS